MYDRIAHLVPLFRDEQERRKREKARLNGLLREAQMACPHENTHEHKDPNHTDDWTECQDCGAAQDRWGKWQPRIDGLIGW